MRSAPFWDITQRRMVISYRRFGTTCRCHLLGLLDLMMGPTVCPETSVWHYHSALRKITEERRSHLHRGGCQQGGGGMSWIKTPEKWALFLCLFQQYYHSVDELHKTFLIWRQVKISCLHAVFVLFFVFCNKIHCISVRELQKPRFRTL